MPTKSTTAKTKKKDTPSLTAEDFDGRTVEVGDIVRSLTGDITGTVKDIAHEDGEYFLRVRPEFQPGGKGVWHSASRMMFSKPGRKR